MLFRCMETTGGRSEWQVQSSFFGKCDGLCCIGATECGCIGALVAAFLWRAVIVLYRYNVVYGLTIIKKVVSRSNCFSGNFIRWKFFEDPTFVDSNFFSGTKIKK